MGAGEQQIEEQNGQDQVQAIATQAYQTDHSPFQDPVDEPLALAAAISTSHGTEDSPLLAAWRAGLQCGEAAPSAAINFAGGQWEGQPIEIALGGQSAGPWAAAPCALATVASFDCSGGIVHQGVVSQPCPVGGLPHEGPASGISIPVQRAGGSLDSSSTHILMP